MTEMEKARLTYHLLQGENVYLPCYDERQCHAECDEYVEWLGGMMPDAIDRVSPVAGMRKVALVDGGYVAFVSGVQNTKIRTETCFGDMDRQ